MSLNIPTAVELLNLFMDPNQLPSAIIAPSHYAKQHESIQNAIKTDTTSSDSDHQKSSFPSVILRVIPPSVDVNKFDGQHIPSDSIINPHKECVHINNFNKIVASQKTLNQNQSVVPSPQSMQHCFNIGFIARLAPEKNPGLFIQFASTLLEDYYPLARFTIVGDGVLRSSLESLARRLEIDWAVHFVGWADEDLPNIIAGMDIVVNPSLRSVCVAVFFCRLL